MNKIKKAQRYVCDFLLISWYSARSSFFHHFLQIDTVEKVSLSKQCPLRITNGWRSPAAIGHTAIERMCDTNMVYISIQKTAMYTNYTNVILN